MADNTPIEWTDATWNPIVGCSIVSPGCTNCYAMKMAARIEAMDAGSARVSHYAGTTTTVNGRAVWTGRVGVAPEHILSQPLRWRRGRRIFVNSMSDLFHDDVSNANIDLVFAVMALSPQHMFQVLTKRPERMRRYLSGAPRRIYEIACDLACDMRLDVVLIARGVDERLAPAGPRIYLDLWPLRNVWLGVSIEDQRRADERVPILLDTPAAVRWVSAEPMLGPIDIAWALSRNPLDIAAGFLARGHFSPGLETLRPLQWGVAGGESGPNARPMHPDWARSLRDQCAAAGVPFVFKQWGAWFPVLDRDRDDPDWRADYRMHERCGNRVVNLAGGTGFHGERVHIMRQQSKRAAGRLLDGVLHDAYPEVRHV